MTADSPVRVYRDLTFWGPGDPRISSWFLMGGPYGVLLILAAYLTFVLKLGPSFMSTRKPYELRTPILIYNVCMVIASGKFFLDALHLTYFDEKDRRYSIFCQGADYTTRDTPRMILCYWYMWTKIAELTDTVFFVLRKKHNQISALHVTHHCIALFITWFIIFNGVMGQSLLFMMFNTAVHIVMYTYYGLAALPPSIRPPLGWKTFVTQFQIGQFFVLALHMLIPFVYDCGYPKSAATVLLSTYLLFIVWFCKFFYSTYLSRKQTIEAKRA